MANQPHKDTVTVSFTLPRALNASVEDYAVRQMTNKSDIIRRALLDYLPKEESEKIRAILFQSTEKPKIALVAEETPPHYNPTFEIPFFGQIAAGQPAISDFHQDETKAVPKSYGKRPHYLLQVRGESMSPDYPDGSFVVVRPINGEYPKKGDIVVADDGNGPTLKKLEYRKTGKPTDSPRKPTPHLVSINPEYDEVIPVSDTPIQGIVIDQYPANFF